MLINEWLPNPIGKDADGEWVELINNSDAPANLSGWYIATGGTQKYKLSGVVEAREYVVIHRSSAKFSLRNTDGELFLYSNQGILVDKASFVGVAPEGKSAQRIGERFVFADPTPGALYEGSPYANILSVGYEPGTVFQHSSSGVYLWLVAFGAAICIAAIALYIVKHHVYFSELFFSKN